MDRDVQEFAALLRELKSRTDRSYAALANHTGVSGSALHRYCSGASVPGEYEVAARFAKACGADNEELLELHRRWALADAERRRAASRAASGASPEHPEPLAVSAASASPSPSEAPPVSGPGSDRVAYGDGAGVGAPGTRVLESHGAEGPEAETHEIAAGGPDAGPGRRPRTPRRLIALLSLAVVAVLLVGVFQLLDDSDSASADSASDRLLLSSECPVVVSMGQTDECVRELQTLLARAGAELDIDGAFGPITQMRVVAFQLYAGLKPNGAVDEQTKRALYAEDRPKLVSWSPARVEKRIREVFTEEPGRAVAIADCSSRFDSLYTLPNSNGTRNWGVFQLYDDTVREFDGTSKKALDPEWNIQTAHRLWAVTRDFSAWDSCDRAYKAGAPTPSSAGR